MKRQTARKPVYDLVLAAMFLALGLVLPLLTGSNRAVGNMLLLMHIPILLCGLICGWQYGGAVGFICPLLRFSIFGAPPMPLGLGMAFELATYGLVVGLVYGLSRRRGVASLYQAMLIAMLCGRLVWGVARTIMVGAANIPFGWEVFLADGFVTALPGIVLQLVLIPTLMIALDRAGLVHLRR